MEILGFQGSLQLADRPGHPHFIVIQFDPFNHQPQISLAECWRAATQAVGQQAAEDFDLFRRHHGASLKSIEERNLDEEAVNNFLHNPKIYMADGGSTSYWVEGSDLYDVVFHIDLDDKPEAITRLNAFGGDFESYFPEANLAMIDMPLIDVMDAAKEDIPASSNDRDEEEG